MNSRQTAISRVVKLMDDFETNNAAADRKRTRLKFAIAQTLQSVGIDEPGSFDAGELEVDDAVNESLQILACEMRARRASIRLSEERRRRTLETSVVSVDLPVLSGVGSGGSSSDAGGASEFLEFVVAPVEDAGQNTQTSGLVDKLSSTYDYHRKRVTTIPGYLKYVLHQKHNMFLRSVEEMDTKKGWEIVLSSPVSYAQVLDPPRPLPSFHNIMVIPTATSANELRISDFDDAHGRGELKDITNSISEATIYLLDPDSELEEPKPTGYVYRLSGFDSTTHTRIPFHLHGTSLEERKDKSTPYAPNFVELARNKRYNVFSRYSVLTTPQDKIQPENEPYLAVRSFVTPPALGYGFMVPLTTEYITTGMSGNNEFILVEHPNTILPSFTASFTYKEAPVDTVPVERSFDKFLYSYQEVLDNGTVRQDKIEAVNAEGKINNIMRPSVIRVDRFVFKSFVPRHTFNRKTSTTESLPPEDTLVDSFEVKNINTGGVQPIYDPESDKVTFFFDGTTVALHAEHGTTYEYRVSTIENTTPVSKINSINAIGTLTKPIPSPLGSVNRSLAFTSSVTGISTIPASELGENPAIVDIIDLQKNNTDEKVKIVTSDVDITRGVPEAAVDLVTNEANDSVEYLSFAMDVVHNGITIPIKDLEYKLGILPINLPPTTNTTFYGSTFYVPLLKSAYAAYLETETASYKGTDITVRAQNKEYFDIIQDSNDGFYNKGCFTVSFKPSLFHKTEQKYGTFKVKNKISFKKLRTHMLGSVIMENDAANPDGTQTLFRVEPFAEYGDFVTRTGTDSADPPSSISSTFKMSYHLMFDSITRFPTAKPYTFICGKPSWDIRPSVANFTGGGFGEFFQHSEKTLFRFYSRTANRSHPFEIEYKETKEHKNGAATFYRMFDSFSYDDYKNNMLSSSLVVQAPPFKDGMVPLHANYGKVLGNALQQTDKEYKRTNSVKTSASGYMHTIKKVSDSQALHTITEGGETTHLVHKLGAFHTFQNDPASTKNYCFMHRRLEILTAPVNIHGNFLQSTEMYEGIYMDRPSELELENITSRETLQKSAMLWSHGLTFVEMLNNINAGGIDVHRFSTHGHAQNRALLMNMMTLLNGEWTSGGGVHADDASILNQHGTQNAGPILEQLYRVNDQSDVSEHYPTTCLPDGIDQDKLKKYIHGIHLDVKSKLEQQLSTGPNKSKDAYQRMVFYAGDVVFPEDVYMRIKPHQYENNAKVTLPSDPSLWTLGTSEPVVKQVVYVKKVDNKLVPVSQIFDIQRRDKFEHFASNAGLFGTVDVDGTHVDGGGVVLERIPSLTFDFSNKKFKEHNQSNGYALKNRGIVSQPVGGGPNLLAPDMNYRTINSVIDVPALNSREVQTFNKYYPGRDFETFGVVLYMEFKNTDTRKMGHMVAQGHANVDDAKA